MKLRLLAGVLALATTIAAAEPPKPLLWKLEREQTTIYLLGTIHVLREDDYPLAPVLEAAFADAERVAFEIPPAEATAPATAQAMLARAQFGDGRTLSQVLPADVYKSLDGALRDVGAALMPFEALEPWFVSITLAILEAQRAGFDPALGLDNHLIQRAAAAGKTTQGLESAQDQIDALDGIPMAEQIAGLRQSLAQDSSEDLRLLHRLWRNGDAEGLARETHAELAELPVTYRRVNVDRNRRWLPQIEALLDDAKGDDTLVVVGALHLLGEDGLVELLEAKGYTVVRL